MNQLVASIDTKTFEKLLNNTDLTPVANLLVEEDSLKAYDKRKYPDNEDLYILINIKDDHLDVVLTVETLAMKNIDKFDYCLQLKDYTSYDYWSLIIDEDFDKDSIKEAKEQTIEIAKRNLQARIYHTYAVEYMLNKIIDKIYNKYIQDSVDRQNNNIYILLDRKQGTWSYCISNSNNIDINLFNFYSVPYSYLSHGKENVVRCFLLKMNDYIECCIENYIYKLQNTKNQVK